MGCSAGKGRCDATDKTTPEGQGSSTVTSDGKQWGLMGADRGEHKGLGDTVWQGF